ncbi:structural protein [Cellulophaga phage phi48:2]|uniref:structural protein n=1 Tax=Cellulophaga phage phi48:2 TaxID=1327968 RepID=UPI000351D9FD|nr:structural protein [Cellulophaga phage phi48:2]AGO47257.1 structural protein [Cellulophaga phage phi48:2]
MRSRKKNATIWSIAIVAVAVVVGSLFPSTIKDGLNKIGIKDLDKKVGDNKEA